MIRAQNKMYNIHFSIILKNITSITYIIEFATLFLYYRATTVIIMSAKQNIEYTISNNNYHLQSIRITNNIININYITEFDT